MNYVGLFKLAYNVSQTCEGKDLQVQIFNLKKYNQMKHKFSINRLTLAFASLLLAVVFSSCKGKELEHKIILSKSNESFFNEPLPDGWCRFFYKTHENSQWIEFKDKCEKYNVGDTIVGVSKNYR